MSGLSGVGNVGSAPYAARQFQPNLFSKIDLTGAGSVSESEAEGPVSKAGGGSQGADSLSSVLDPKSTGGVNQQQFSQALPRSGLSHDMQAQMIGYQAQGWPGASQPGGQLAQSLFSQVDGNGDGAISKAELEQAVTGAGGTKAGADALYAKLDPKNTGSVSEQQFAKSLFEAMPARTRPHHHHHHGDQGATDAASAGSATDALTALFNADGGGAGNSPTQIAQNMFSQTDTNGDGAITQSELEQAVGAAGGGKAGADALFAKLDPNGTGNVSNQQFMDTLQPPSAGGNTSQDALLALLDRVPQSSANPPVGAAGTATAAALNSADLARAFSLYQSQLEQQVVSGMSATQRASV